MYMKSSNRNRLQENSESSNSDVSKYFAKNKLNRQDKYILDKYGRILYADNTFPKIIDIRIFIEEIETRILEAFGKGSKLFPKIEMSEQFLLKHKGSKLKLVVLYVDLVDSISMIRNFSVDFNSDNKWNIKFYFKNLRFHVI